MIVRMGLLQKRPDLSTEAFRGHWAQRHSTLAATLPGLRRYHQNHVTDVAQRAIDFQRGPKDYDGFSQLWFDDIESMVEAIDANSSTLLADEDAFIADLDIVIAEPTAVIEPPEHSSAIKRMSTLRRRDDISADRFVDEWRVHGDLVRQMPGVLGYVQNVVVARAKDNSGKSGSPTSPYDALPIDGVVEMWFRDAQTLNHAFSSREGRRTMAHASTFIAEINTYLVDCIRVL